MNVAVLGGGNGGYAVAADLALGGHLVRLWRRSEPEAAAVRDAGGITLLADGVERQARLERLTTSLDEAVDGAEVVVVALPATTHDDLGRQLATKINDRQIVLLTPGSFGAYAMAREIARAGGTPPQAFAETGTLPYLARKTGPVAVAVPVRAANLPVGVFPASRTDLVVSRLATLYATLRPCVDALDVALTNPGPVLHPPLVLLNAGPIDGGRFDVHAAGTTPSARRLIDALDAERIAARRGWGYDDYEKRGPRAGPLYPQRSERLGEPGALLDEAGAEGEGLYEGLYGVGAKAKLVASGLWSEVVTLDHRYVTEDVVLGLALLESAARTVGAATPAATGVLQVFGVLLGRALSGRGRALENLGLGDLSVREIRALLHEGWDSTLWNRVVK